mmetsp:Transcript_9442/g.22934  ORF Transcript_9442/g.22934 Transcript_9442/m.22934 type:complete len:91 (+) Transcript_9442:1468-1740(+)
MDMSLQYHQDYNYNSYPLKNIKLNSKAMGRTTNELNQTFSSKQVCRSKLYRLPHSARVPQRFHLAAKPSKDRNSSFKKYSATYIFVGFTP